MRMFLLWVVVAVLSVLTAHAQRIQVVDDQGNGVPYASVLTTDAQYIGETNLNGVLADVKSHQQVTISHVAYQPQTVTVAQLNDGRVVLEDADYSIAEITVSPKPLVYVQTYYRLYCFSAKEGIVYYRAGLTDNTFNREKKTVSSSSNHVAKAPYGIIKTIMGMLVGSIVDKGSRILPVSCEEHLKSRGAASKLTFKETAPGKQDIVDSKGIVGHVVDDLQDHQRRYSVNTHQLYLHSLEAEGNAKKIKKAKEYDEKSHNRQEADFYLFRIDEDGHYAPEDIIMKQLMTSFDNELSEGGMDHQVLCIQVFTTDRAYVTKDELKARKKANKMKMTQENIRQFEHDHHIPALPSNVQQKIDALWKKK